HDFAERRLRENDLEQEARTNRRDERDDQRFEQPESLVLQIQNEQDVERRNDDTVRDRDVEDQIERDRGADDFGQITGSDGDLTPDPEKVSNRLRVVIATCLREIPSGDDAELAS